VHPFPGNTQDDVVNQWSGGVGVYLFYGIDAVCNASGPHHQRSFGVPFPGVIGGLEPYGSKNRIPVSLQFLVGTCLLASRPFGWEGNWHAVWAMITYLAFSVAVFARGWNTGVPPAGMLKWINSILFWTRAPQGAARTGEILAAVGSLMASALMFKLAFYSAC
jgi:hypothetical protein